MYKRQSVGKLSYVNPKFQYCPTVYRQTVVLNTSTVVDERHINEHELQPTTTPVLQEIFGLTEIKIITVKYRSTRAFWGLETAGASMTYEYKSNTSTVRFFPEYVRYVSNLPCVIQERKDTGQSWTISL